jgi:hypothetical protein
VRWQHDRSFACKQSHIAFAIEGKDRTITELRKQSDLRTENVVFVEGETKDTLPGYHLEGEVDLVLLDGPHAYPLPQIEFAYLFPGDQAWWMAGRGRHPDSLGLRTVSLSGKGIISGTGGSSRSHGILPADQCG